MGFQIPSNAAEMFILSFATYFFWYNLIPGLVALATPEARATYALLATFGTLILLKGKGIG